MISLASATDKYYYIDSELNVTTNVSLVPDQETYIMLSIPGEYAPTYIGPSRLRGDYIFEMFDVSSGIVGPAFDGGGGTIATWNASLDDYLNSQSSKIQHKQMDFLYNISAVSEVVNFGLSTDNDTFDTAVYLSMKDTASPDAYFYVYSGGSQLSNALLRNDVYENGTYKIYTNATHATFYSSEFPAETETISLSSLSTTVDLIPSLRLQNNDAGNGYASVSNITIRQYYDDVPSIETIYIGDEYALYKISNPNTDTYTNYQIDVYGAGLPESQTYDDLMVDEYSTTPFPYPTYPTNNSTITLAYPPISHSITFTWEDSGASSYTYNVYRSDGAVVSTGSTANTQVTVSLSAGNYYWTIEETSGVYEEVRAYFTIANEYTLLDETSITGIVYEISGGVQEPISDAVVYLYNDTYTKTTTVGLDGYYSFTGLAANETYYLKASAPDYDDSEISAVTTVDDTSVVNDILLVKGTSQYAPHYVKYVVKNIWDTRYANVNVNVYKGSNVLNVAYRSGVTGPDGSITFRLDENQLYTLTFLSTTQGINETLTHYPKDDLYSVYVIQQSLEPEEEYSVEDITTRVTKETINSTHAYINVTYYDELDETTSLKINLNQSNTGDLFNQNTIDSYSGATSDTTVSFIVENYAGEDYFVTIDADHTTFGDVTRTYAVSFYGMEDDHGFEQVYIWIAIACIMFSGAVFKATNARTGTFIVSIVAWIFIIMGWFDNLGEKGVLAITAATTLATILSIAAIMAKGEKEG